jgi:putative ABC transport system substrate-binding protein
MIQHTVMSRRRLIGAVSAGLLAWPIGALAQGAGRLPRPCFLIFEPGTVQSPSARFDPFFLSLRDLGYVAGRTIIIDYLSADDRTERSPDLAAECVRLKTDIIAASTTPGAQAAKSATRMVPIVMLALGDPVGTGLVDSLARPGGNVTGVSSMTTGLAAKRLQLLKEVVPRVSRVLVLAHLVDPIAPLQVKALQEVAPSLGVTLHVRDVRTADDVSAAFDTGAKERANGLLTTSGSIFLVQRARVVELATRHRLPAIYPYSVFLAHSDGLMAYEIEASELYRHAAMYIDKILKGAKPSELAVQQPTTFKLVINLKTAGALGPTVPPSVLLRADEVIQ